MSFSPSGNQLSNLPQSTVKFYDKRFRENLKANTPFVRCAERLDLPMKSGNQYEMFMYVPLAANTNQTTEGTVGSSLSVSVLTTTATIGEYAIIGAPMHKKNKSSYIGEYPLGENTEERGNRRD